MSYLNREDIIGILNLKKGKLKFHTKFRNGNPRIYINSMKTKYYAGGSGYEKSSSVIAMLINDLLGSIDYKNAYTGSRSGIRMLNSGIGIDTVINALDTIGAKLVIVYCGDDFDVYELDLSNQLERINNGI